MNILPLVLALVLMMSVLTVERLEKFKNLTAVQIEYQNFIKDSERKFFNARQKKLANEYDDKAIKQVSFRSFMFKDARNDSNITKQNRLILKELLKVLYSETFFYKEMEKKRPHFIDEMLAATEKAADEMPKGSLTSVEDIVRLELGDPELQDVFYRMLKGTLSHKEFRELEDSSLRKREKAYVSLLSYINNNSEQRVEVQKAPAVILKAIFGSDEVVQAILAKRNELAHSKDSGASQAFASEFKDKHLPGLDGTVLDFKITPGSDLSEYD